LTRRFAFVLAVLSACAPPPAPSYRVPGTPIYSVALFEQSSLSGSWYEVAGFPLQAGCGPGPVTFAPQAQGAGCFLPLSGTAVSSGPGRFTAGGRKYWVLWIDGDARTAVIGTPSGAFGAVLNRDAAIPSDRMEAARRVLAANGYDMARLVER
jgi:apolipoprotein D and lipocalin family protein